MSDAVVRSAHRLHSPSMPTAAREPQGSQLRVLFWKEWREQRLLLAAIAALIVFVAASQRMHEFLECDVAVAFCAVFASLLLGTAVGSDRVSGRERFLTASPIRPRLLYTAKLAFGLAATSAALLLSIGACWVFAPMWQELGLCRVSVLPWLSLFCFSMSHYGSSFVRHPISAMGVGLLTGIVTIAIAASCPANIYLTRDIENLSPHGFLAVFAIGMLVLAHGRYVRVMDSQGTITGRRVAGWVLLPTLLLGLPPLVAGLGIFAVDLLHLDPTDVKRLTGIAVSPDGDRVFAFGERAERYEWIPGLPSSIVVSASTRERRAREAFTLPGTAGPIGYTWSPNDRHLVAWASWLRRSPANDLAVEPLAIIDMEDGSTSGLPSASWVHWLPDGRLVFYVAQGLGRHEWGTYDPETQELATFRLPRVMSEAELYYRVVELRKGRVEQRPIPSAYRSSLPFKGTNLVLLVPRRERNAPRPDLPLLLLDVSNGECENLEARLGGPPSAGWANMVASPTWDGRWLLIVPDADSKLHSSTWYAVDIAQAEVFRHESPAPWPQTPQVSDSGWLSSLGADGRTLLLCPLRDTDRAAQFAIAPRSGGFRLDLSRSAWLNGTQFAFCKEPESRSEAQDVGWLRRFAAPGVFLVDVETRHIQPLWAPEEMHNHWQVKPWPAR